MKAVRRPPSPVSLSPDRARSSASPSDAAPRTSLPGRHDAGAAPDEAIAPFFTPAGDIDLAFRKFAHLTAEFSRQVRSRRVEIHPLEPRAMAAKNVRLARTMFGKWSLEILSVLYAMRQVGFEEMRRELRGITPRVLSGRLKVLEQHQLVERTVRASRPIRVDYRLTPKGFTVAVLGEPVFLFLRHWESVAPPGPLPRRG